MGYFSIPRAVVSFGIDAIIWAVFSPGAATWATVTQPVKAIARAWSKELIKTKMKGILVGFSKTLAQAITKIATKLLPLIKKAVGWIFRS